MRSYREAHELRQSQTQVQALVQVQQDRRITPSVASPISGEGSSYIDLTVPDSEEDSEGRCEADTESEFHSEARSGVKRPRARERVAGTSEGDSDSSTTEYG